MFRVSGRLQAWLQEHDTWALAWLGNRVSDVRFYAWRWLTNEGRRSP